MQVAVLALAIVCTGCREDKEEHFANLEVAKARHMPEKGWVPSFLPQDTRDISVLGDLDAGSVYGTYSSNDIAVLRKHCENADDSLHVPGYGPDWFRDTLKEADTAAALRRRGYDVLQCEDGFKIVAFGARQWGYYWSVRR
jgi:hypothetical protein